MHGPFLVPVDGSPASLRALDHAVTLAAALHTRVEIASVVDLGQLDFYDGMYHTPDEVEALTRRLRTDVLEHARARVPAGIDHHAVLLRGPIVRTLLQHAAEINAGLFVLGRTGKGALERLVDGSVSRALAFRAPLPVLLVS
jgi:nucleotide-binding universal stress UspA family protein